MARPIVLKGKKVSLGVLERTDVPLMYAGFNLPEVRRYLKRPERVQTLEDAYQLYDSSRTDEGSVTFALSVNTPRGEKKTGSDLAGIISLSHVSVTNRTAELEYVILRDYWEKGYASEGVSLAAAHAFSMMNLRKLVARVYGPNIASVRVLEKNGFREAVRLKRHVFVDGEYADELLFELERPGQ